MAGSPQSGRRGPASQYLAFSSGAQKDLAFCMRRILIVSDFDYPEVGDLTPVAVGRILNDAWS
jgi:hypothetical protein